jgi:hypothetical protein
LLEADVIHAVDVFVGEALVVAVGTDILLPAGRVGREGDDGGYSRWAWP